MENIENSFIMDESILKQLPINIPLLIVGNKSDLTNDQSFEKVPKKLCYSFLSIPNNPINFHF